MFRPLFDHRRERHLAKERKRAIKETLMKDKDPEMMSWEDHQYVRDMTSALYHLGMTADSFNRLNVPTYRSVRGYTARSEREKMINQRGNMMLLMRRAGKNGKGGDDAKEKIQQIIKNLREKAERNRTRAENSENTEKKERAETVAKKADERADNMERSLQKAVAKRKKR